MSLPGLPIITIADPSNSNTEYPELTAILGLPTPDSVGADAANRQPGQLDTRTETLRDRVNTLATVLNALSGEMLQRDGAAVGSYMRGDLSMRDADLGTNSRVTNLAVGVAPQDGVNKGQLDALSDLIAALESTVNTAILRDGSVVMTSHLNLGSFRIRNLADPLDPTDAATRGYVSSVVDGLATEYMRLDGTTPMSGTLQMGNFLITGVTDPVNPTDVVTKGYLDGVAAQIQTAPVGSIAWWAGSTSNIPIGWLLCDGATYGTGSYPDLYTAIGTTFDPNGSQFKMPDIRGRAIAGMDNMGGASADVMTVASADQMGGVAGQAEIVLTFDQMPAHNHTFNDLVVGISTGGSFSGPAVAASNYATDPGPTGNTDINNGGVPHDNVQPTFILIAIIKT